MHNIFAAMLKCENEYAGCAVSYIVFMLGGSAVLLLRWVAGLLGCGARALRRSCALKLSIRKSCSLEILVRAGETYGGPLV
jgi:hypothetical protein